MSARIEATSGTLPNNGVELTVQNGTALQREEQGRRHLALQIIPDVGSATGILRDST